MRGVVSDTGPVLHLHEAQVLDLLRLTGEVHIPAAVDTELPAHLLGWGTQRPGWLLVERLIAPFSEEAIAWRQAGLLDPGEAEAIALARQINAHWLLTDDAAARLFAQTLGIEVHGSLGIVLWTVASGYLPPRHPDV